MEKVIAVVVSYNRQALLSECIDALRAQTRRPDTILVVNNGSTDNTEAWLKSQSDLVFITQDNVGSGGGFNTGISWAYKNNFSWIWCMDDDGYPKNDALEVLLNVDTPDRSLLNCAVINKEDRKSFVWNTGNFKTIDEVDEELIRGIGHPFNGTLLHRSIVAKVGLPKSSLFLWGDESEYYYRIVKKHQIPVYTVSKSIHYHPASAYTYKQDWDFTSCWKMYFYVRNRFHVHNVKFSNKVLACANYLGFLFAFAGVIVLFQKTNKIKKLSFLLWPLRDALKNDFSATPNLILSRLNIAKEQSFHQAMTAPVKKLWSVLFETGSAIQGNTAAA
jgi:GT2 family glycosyltransferase